MILGDPSENTFNSNKNSKADMQVSFQKSACTEFNPRSQRPGMSCARVGNGSARVRVAKGESKAVTEGVGVIAQGSRGPFPILVRLVLNAIIYLVH